MRGKPAKSRDTNTKRGIRLALLFSALVIGIIAFSGLLRAYWAVKSSTFSDYRYNVLVGSRDPQIVSFSKDEVGSTIEVLTFEPVHRVGDLSLEDVAIPINAIMESQDNLSRNNFKSKFLSLLFKSKNNIAIIDKFKLALSIQKMDSGRVEFSSSKGLNSLGIEALFKDLKIAGERQSIQIVNDSGASGLGNRLANVVTTVGGNVVLVTTDDRIRPKSVIEYKDNSSTLKFLAGYLGYQLEKKDFSGVADIIVILGKDSVGTSKF